jgi:branched-chain amino acid transport system ATP-binding protein
MNPRPDMLLRVTGLRSGYGALEVLRGVDLEVHPSEVVAIIGSNGAGKTTLIRTLSGLLPRHGSIRLGDREINRASTMQIVAEGLVAVPEGRGVFPTMTVLENLKLGAYWRRRMAHLDADIDEVITLFPRLRERFDQLAGSLSGGEQQMLAIGRALLAKPSVLMLDEPSMGLSPLFSKVVMQVIEQLRANRVSVLLVEQNADAALRVADRAYVMERGNFTFSGQASQLRSDARVRAAYLGGPIPEIAGTLSHQALQQPQGDFA